VPTYQYACTECGHQLEAVQSFSDAPLTECPNCHGRLRKQFSAVGIVFKGSGFYRTDSRSTSSASTGSDSATKEKTADTSKPAEKPSEKAAASKPSGSSDTSASSSGSSGKSPVSTSS
jgi:putative FmdB family regulatory protein